MIEMHKFIYFTQLDYTYINGAYQFQLAVICIYKDTGGMDWSSGFLTECVGWGAEDQMGGGRSPHF